jgi:hypothetical protein
MIALLAIAIAAGAASALMFASIISGAAVSLLLVYLAPLPLMVVAIGWGSLAAAVSGIAATAALAVLLGWSHCVGFALAVALPSWWLGHLALLGRPVAAAAPGDKAAHLEWYPVGRILVWITVAAIVMTAAIILLSFGTDIQSITETAQQGVRETMRQAESDVTAEQIGLLAKLFVLVAPVMLPVSVMLMLTLNLWLAAKVALTSGRLHRPWPNLQSIALPPITLAILSAAIAFCFVGGILALLAKTVATALLFAFAITGFAVLHVLTLSLNNRAFWLASAYAVTFLFSVPIVVVALLGIADAVFGLRQRYLHTRPPPLPAA